MDEDEMKEVYKDADIRKLSKESKKSIFVAKIVDEKNEPATASDAEATEQHQFGGESQNTLSPGNG